MFKDIQSIITNDLGGIISEGQLFAGIIGEQPSKYAKSPTIWNPTLKALGIPAVYVALDVTKENLKPLMDALRACPTYLGGNVTVPHKINIISYLDDLDEMARHIGAVNTIVRAQDGRLIGYNTDGQGGIDSLIQGQTNQSRPFLESLKGLRVTLIGAGGAARGLAFYLGREIGSTGTLTLVNRDAPKAASLAREIQLLYGNCRSTILDRVSEVIMRSDLVVNATTVGQSGLRPVSPGLMGCLEPYSPLVSFKVPGLTYTGEDSRVFLNRWMRSASESIQTNNAGSLSILLGVPVSTAFWDIIYSPLETVFLRQARLTGHRTLNGKSMNIVQAANGFFHHVCAPYLKERAAYTPDTYHRILEIMHAVW